MTEMAEVAEMTVNGADVWQWGNGRNGLPLSIWASQPFEPISHPATPALEDISATSVISAISVNGNGRMRAS
jgi:hypothetical protein